MLALCLLFAPSFAADERFDYDQLDRLIRVIDEQGRVTEYVYDAAGNLLQVITDATPASAPVVISIAPDRLRRGDSKRILATGTGLTGARLSASDPGLQLTDVLVSATQVEFTLNVLNSAVLGPQAITFSNAAGSTSAALIVDPVLPRVSVVPAPLAVPPDNTTRPFTIRLSSADNIDHSVTLSSENTAIASVAPATLTVLAGQTEESASITGHQAGLTNITLASSTLGTTSFPVFVTAEFRGFNTSFAPLVGVVVEQPPQPEPEQTITPFGAPDLGIVVGSYLQVVSPNAVVVGTGPTELTITGKGLSGVTDVAIRPADGVTLGGFTVSPDGSAITVPVTVTADAATTMRRIVVRAGTDEVPASHPEADRIRITFPAPEVISIDPINVAVGTIAQTFTIRGTNLRDIQRVDVMPPTGVFVDANPTSSADGTVANLRITVTATASLGPHVLTVVTRGGTSDTQATSANTFHVVNEVRERVTPILAPSVGVVKQVEPGSPPTQSIGLTAAQLGVTVGAVVTDVTPDAGSIGGTVTLTVTGSELQGVSEIRFVPDTGIVVNAPTVAPDGNSLTADITIASDAPQTLRTVHVLSGTTVLPASPAQATQFRVTAPPPEINSLTPLLIQLGTTSTALTIRGKNFQNAQQVEIVPPNGVTVASPSVNSDGTQLTVNLVVAASAAVGPRVMVVHTPGGATSAIGGAANTIELVAGTTNTFTPINAPALGVVKEIVPPPPPETTIDSLTAPALGVVLETDAPPPTQNIFVPASHLGVAVGAVALRSEPLGLVRGGSGTLVIHGFALNDVNSVTMVPATGITLGTPVASADGTQVSVPVSVAADAPTGYRWIMLARPSGAVPRIDGNQMRFYVGIGVPSFDSITPILANQGETLTLTVRGANLQDAIAVTATPVEGIRFGTTINVNATGTELTVQMHILPDAPLGSRVIQVVTPAAASSGDPVPANTFTVFAP